MTSTDGKHLNPQPKTLQTPHDRPERTHSFETHPGVLLLSPWVDLADNTSDSWCLGVRWTDLGFAFMWFRLGVLSWGNYPNTGRSPLRKFKPYHKHPNLDRCRNHSHKLPVVVFRRGLSRFVLHLRFKYEELWLMALGIDVEKLPQR